MGINWGGTIVLTIAAMFFVTQVLGISIVGMPAPQPALSMIPLAITFNDVQFTVSTQAGTRIGGALIEVDIPDLWGGYDGLPDYSLVTDANGYASRMLPQCVLHLKTTKSGFKESNTAFDTRGPTGTPRSVNVILEPGSGVSGYTVTVWLIDPTRKPVTLANVEIGGVNHAMTADGFTVFSGVATGTYTAHIYGTYSTFNSFDYSVPITVTGSGDWTGNVASKTLLPGRAQYDFDVVKFLSENWVLTLAAVGGLVLWTRPQSTVIVQRFRR
jgi:hypothetical protein